MSEDTTTAAAAAQQGQEWEQREAQIRERALFQTVVIIEDVQFLLDQLQAEREHNRKLREMLDEALRTLETALPMLRRAGVPDGTMRRFHDAVTVFVSSTRSLLDDSEAVPQPPPPKDTSSSKGKGDVDEGGNG